jgi:3-dehydroquinate dehydratase/shikimate dehydrogenase
VGDEILKAALAPQSLDDVLRVYRAAGELKDTDKILLCMGDYGINTRILAERLGSFLSYVSPRGEPDMPGAAPGQLDPRELTELYRFRSITGKTRIFGVTGYPLKATGSPPFFNTVFGLENIDAVYVPFPADSIRSFLRLAEEIGLEGASVTVPYKEEVLDFLSRQSPEVESIGACNTLKAGSQGWMGYNTDALGFSGSLLEFTGRKNFKGLRITLVGAGGAARAAASEIHRLGGKALILNRTVSRARDLAEPYRFAWGGLDSQGIDRIGKFRDIIVQTTSLGMEPDTGADPLELYKFSGSELVMDLVYKPERTRCLSRAGEAGCKVLNGYDMLLRQARYQYVLFMGKEFPPALASRIKF